MNDSEIKKFNELRKRGIRILWINLIISLLILLSGYFFPIMKKYVFYSGVYFLFSVFLLIKRYLKKTIPKEDNYIFGKKLGDKMNNVAQKFIFEAMMISLVLIIVASLSSTFYALFFTDINLFLKIVTGIGGIFGSIFMLMILITTFQSYKSLSEMLKVKDLLTDVTIDLNNVKGGINENAKKTTG